MDDVKRKYVLPGDVITSGPYRAEDNVHLFEDKIISTTVGISEVFDSGVRVIPLAGVYIPRIDDFVIGKIKSHTSLSWEVDINSCYPGILPAQDVFGRDFNPKTHELTSRLKTGDLIACRIANYDRSRDPLLTIGDRDLGKIDEGELIKISPSKVPRLIGKRGSMIQTIEGATKAMITIGQNGYVVVSAENTEGLLKALDAIRMVEDQAHVANLTERIQEMLGSKSE
ncbi:MAG: exosome complex RNA-binding protein Rrp4 [Candidatus Nitrosotenuis sp.]